MKKIVLIITFLLTICFFSFSQNHYYWYNSEKIKLKIDTTKYFIKTKDLISTKDKLAAILKLNDSLIFKLSDTTFIIYGDDKLKEKVKNQKLKPKSKN